MAAGPEIRTNETAPTPAGVATAAMVEGWLGEGLNADIFVRKRGVLTAENAEITETFFQTLLNVPYVIFGIFVVKSK